MSVRVPHVGVDILHLEPVRLNLRCCMHCKRAVRGACSNRVGWPRCLSVQSKGRYTAMWQGAGQGDSKGYVGNALCKECTKGCGAVCWPATHTAMLTS